MQDADIFLKTDAGRDEIKSRARGLSMAQRAILLMVDGQRNVAALRTVIAGSKAPADTLEMLLDQGLIAAVASRDPEAIVSISTPRSASTARVPPAPVATFSEPPSAVVDPLPSSLRGLAYDQPLDLTLATIVGPSTFPSPEADAPPGPSSAAGRYEHLYTMVNEIVRDFLPAHRRYFVQLKIERCGTADDLLALLDTVEAALAKARGEAFANEVVSRVRNAAG